MATGEREPMEIEVPELPKQFECEHDFGPRPREMDQCVHCRMFWHQFQLSLTQPEVLRWLA